MGLELEEMVTTRIVLTEAGHGDMMKRLKGRTDQTACIEGGTIDVSV